MFEGEAHLGWYNILSMVLLMRQVAFTDLQAESAKLNAPIREGHGATG